MGDLRVLPEKEEDFGHVEPEESDGQRRGEEEEDGAVESEGQKLGLVGAEGLGAERFHAERKPGEDGVARDVGEGDGERAGGER